MGLPWCEQIIKALKDWDRDDLIELLSTDMIVMDPVSRGSARECFTNHCESLLPAVL